MPSNAVINDITVANQSCASHARYITLVRHGRTQFNATHRLQGQIDIPLDEVGKWQARCAADELRKLYVPGADELSKQQPSACQSPERQSSKQVDNLPLVVASDLGRAQETAHYFADPLGVEVHSDVRVRERSFGELEGMPIAEMKERWPEDFIDWSFFKDGEVRHGAELKQEVGNRGARAVDEWAHTIDTDHELFVFSHGAWISQTVQTLMGWSQIHTDFADLVSMHNAHWVRMMLFDMADGTERYRLVSYDQGPAIAYAVDWNNPPAGLLRQ